MPKTSLGGILKIVLNHGCFPSMWNFQQLPRSMCYPLVWILTWNQILSMAKSDVDCQKKAYKYSEGKDLFVKKQKRFQDTIPVPISEYEMYSYCAFVYKRFKGAT